MSDIVVAAISAGSMIVGAILTFLGVLWKARKDKEAKKIEQEIAREVAQIEADTSQRINIAEVLSARVNVLEASSQEQDRLVMKLTRENATLEAKNQLLTAENVMLEKDSKKQQGRIKELESYTMELKHHIQTEVSEARYRLDEASESGDEQS